MFLLMDMSFYTEFCRLYMIDYSWVLSSSALRRGGMYFTCYQPASCGIPVPEFRKGSRETERKEKWKMIYDIFLIQIGDGVLQGSLEEGKCIFKCGISF